MDDKQKGYEYAKTTDECNIDIYWVRDAVLDITSNAFMVGYDEYVSELEDA